MNVRILLVSIGLLTTIMVSCQNKSSKVKLSSEMDTISYYLGKSIGSNLLSSPMKEVNVKAFAMGLQEVMNGAESEEDLNQLNTIIGEYMQKLDMLASEIYLEEGLDFLAENMKREGVTTTATGLQYEVIKEGTGPKPVATDMVTVHYHGTLLDGQVFDSSIERGEPAQFPLNRVIPGWTEGVQLMSVGSKYKFFVPTELAYGARPRQGGIIKPNMTLIFEVELLSIDEATE